MTRKNSGHCFYMHTMRFVIFNVPHCNDLCTNNFFLYLHIFHITNPQCVRITFASSFWYMKNKYIETMNNFLLLKIIYTNFNM